MLGEALEAQEAGGGGGGGTEEAMGGWRKLGRLWEAVESYGML